MISNFNTICFIDILKLTTTSQYLHIAKYKKNIAFYSSKKY